MTTRTWHVIDEGTLVRMLERAREGEEIAVVLAMASANARHMELEPDWREMAGAVWDHWPPLSKFREIAVRAAYPAIASVLDGVSQRMNKYLARQHEELKRTRGRG